MAQITLNSSGVASNGSLVLQSNGTTTAVTVDASQNVGLGVTPSAWGVSFKSIDVNTYGAVSSSATAIRLFANSYGDGTNFIYKTTGAASRYDQSGGAHSWLNAASGTAGNTISFTTAMTLDASGNLGIGTSSPSRKLVVSNAGAAGFEVGPGTGLSSGNEFLNYNRSTSLYVQKTEYASSYAFYAGTAGSTRAVDIDSSGNLLVGATAFRSGERMIVEKNNDVICAKATGSSSAIPYLAWNDVTSGNNSFMNFGTEASYTSRGSIDYNRAGGLVRYNTSSDATLKNIIGDSDGVKSIEILNSTRIRDYSWKDDTTNKTQIGVIAQELYETFKGAVSVGGEVEKTDEEGNVTTEYRPWAVDKTAFTFHLVKGWQEHQRIIQEQQAIITQLQADVAALKGTA